MMPTAVSLGERFHDAAGCHWGGRPHLGPCRDRSREAGRALTEVRTVLSRAETARQTLADHSAAGVYGPFERARMPKPSSTVPGLVDAGEPPYDPAAAPFDDPDHALMLAALDQVLAALAPWRRGPGKTAHWVADTGPAQLVAEPAPDAYHDEVGDEMFMGGQAVLAGLRERLCASPAIAPDALRAALDVMDGYLRELVEEYDDDDEEK